MAEERMIQSIKKNTVRRRNDLGYEKWRELLDPQTTNLLTWGNYIPGTWSMVFILPQNPTSAFESSPYSF